jgi:hypothetical protein
MENIPRLGSERLEALNKIYRSPDFIDKTLDGHFICDGCRMSYDLLDPYEDPDDIPKDSAIIANINNRLKIVKRVVHRYGKEPQLRRHLGKIYFARNGFESLPAYFRKIYGDDMALLIASDVSKEAYTFNCKNCIKLDDDDFFSLMQMQEEIAQDGNDYEWDTPF